MTRPRNPPAHGGMERAFREQLRHKTVSRKAVTDAAADRAELTWRLREVEKILDQDITDELKRTWFYYGWNAAREEK